MTEDQRTVLYRELFLWPVVAIFLMLLVRAPSPGYDESWLRGLLNFLLFVSALQAVSAGIYVRAGRKRDRQRQPLGQ